MLDPPTASVWPAVPKTKDILVGLVRSIPYRCLRRRTTGNGRPAQGVLAMRHAELTELRIESVKALLDPLADFWSPRDSERSVARVEGEDVPEPYRSLLVHDRDMTPTLETYWDSEIQLDVLARAETEGDLLRHVILRTKAGRPAAFGAIRIHLGVFPAVVREEILACLLPLGAQLRIHAIPHTSAPTGFFRMAPSSLTREVFGWTDAAVHYGRHNRLSGGHGALAEVVEILPSLP